MSTPSNNVLQAVATYIEVNLKLLGNYMVFAKSANTKCRDFQKEYNQLGSTVNIRLPLRGLGVPSLVASFEPVVQRFLPLTTAQQYSIAFPFDANQFIYNDLNEYISEHALNMIMEIGGQVDSEIATRGIDSTYRFYAGNIDQTNPTPAPITTYQSVAQANAQWRNYGNTPMLGHFFIPDVAEPAIIGNGLNQFVPKRNEEIANSWDLGEFNNVHYYRTNLLQNHIAGTVGLSNTTLTVVSLSVDGTQLTLSGATAFDANAIKENDKLFFLDGVSGQPDMRYLTFTSYKPSANPVQVRATADAGADGSGNVVVNIYPALISSNTTQAYNINNPVVAGMQVKALNSHKAGFVVGENALYLSMPKLPDSSPWIGYSKTDQETGISARAYYGMQFGLNVYGWVFDTLWGSAMADEYAMMVAFPI